MIRMQRALLGALLFLLTSALPVLGHAELIETDPIDGDTIETPYTVTATFTEELLERSSIVVNNAGGDEVARGEPDPEDRAAMVVDLPLLPPGEYRANWTARTADGHTERGFFTFTVAATPTPAPPTPTPSPTASAPLATAGPTLTSGPTAPPTATPTLTRAPSVSPGPVVPGPGGTGTDAVLAVAIGAVAIGAICLFLFARTRR